MPAFGEIEMEGACSPYFHCEFWEDLRRGSFRARCCYSLNLDFSVCLSCGAHAAPNSSVLLLFSAPVHLLPSWLEDNHKWPPIGVCSEAVFLEFCKSLFSEWHRSILSEVNEELVSVGQGY